MALDPLFRSARLGADLYGTVNVSGNFTPGPFQPESSGTSSLKVFYEKYCLTGSPNPCSNFADLHLWATQLERIRHPNEEQKFYCDQLIEGALAFAGARNFPCDDPALMIKNPSKSGPRLRRFIISEGLRPDPDRNDRLDDDNKAFLTAMLSRYSYNQFNLADLQKPIQINREFGALLVPDSHRHDEFPNEGTCSELMLTAYRDIKSLFPGLNVKRVMGREPTYFSGQQAIHFFLLISDFEHRCNPYVYDPSFGIFKPLAESGYQIIRRTPDGEEYEQSNSTYLRDKMGMPLGFSHHGGLYYLFADFEQKDPLRLALVRDGKTSKIWPLNDRNIKEDLAIEVAQVYEAVKHIDEIGSIEVTEFNHENTPIIVH